MSIYFQKNGTPSQIGGGGITQSVLDRIADLENRLENVTNMLQGKLDASKVTNSTTITEQGYAMDARQANPVFDWSLAGKICSVEKKIDKISFFKTYPTLEKGVAFIDCPMSTINSVALVNCTQGNGMYIQGAECMDGKIKIRASTDGDGAISVVVAIKY